VFATDPLQGTLTYSMDQRSAVNLEVISAERAKQIIEMNRRGEKPNDLGGKHTTIEGSEIGYSNVVGQDDVNRFDRRSRGRFDRQGNRPRGNDRPHNRPNNGQHDRDKQRKQS